MASALELLSKFTEKSLSHYDLPLMFFDNSVAAHEAAAPDGGLPLIFSAAVELVSNLDSLDVSATDHRNTNPVFLELTRGFGIVRTPYNASWINHAVTQVAPDSAVNMAVSGLVLHEVVDRLSKHCITNGLKHLELGYGNLKAVAKSPLLPAMLGEDGNDRNARFEFDLNYRFL